MLKVFRDALITLGLSKKAAALIMILIVVGGVWLFQDRIPWDKFKFKREQDTGLIYDIPTSTQSEDVPIITTRTCKVTTFAESNKGWDFSLYNKLKDGFYKPKPFEEKGFPAPEIWLSDSVSTLNSELEFKAEIRGDDPERTALIIEIGKEPKIVRFLIGDGGPQIVGFERIIPVSGGYDFERLAPAQILPAPIKKSTPQVVTIKSSHFDGNQIDYEFIIDYISAKTGTSIKPPPSFQYSVFLPDPKPESIGSDFKNTRFGFAVYQGSSIRPISFQICPLD